MKKNMGKIDRIIRVSLAFLVSVLYLADHITETGALILGVFAVVFLVTSSLGFCPLYLPLNIKTCREDKC